jgi:hypothetical protein
MNERRSRQGTSTRARDQRDEATLRLRVPHSDGRVNLLARCAEQLDLDLDPTPTTDGRFHIEGVLAGTWSLYVSSSDPAYDGVSIPIVVEDGGGASGVGTIPLARRRVGQGEEEGKLGVLLDEQGRVDVRRGRGGGHQVRDIVVSVDGVGVAGPNRYLLGPRTTVAPGREVTFGLARGGTVRVVAASPEPERVEVDH